MSEQDKPQIACENCGRIESSHREVGGERVCYPDTFPDQPMIFRGPAVVMPDKPRYVLREDAEHYRTRAIEAEEDLSAAEAALEQAKRDIAELETRIQKMMTQHRYGGHTPPPEAFTFENAENEPEGERLRRDLDDWLENNKIVGMMLDTKKHQVEISYGPHLPNRIRPVLTKWGSIYVVDEREGVGPTGNVDDALAKHKGAK